jgi:hypothetical protein
MKNTCQEELQCTMHAEALCDLGRMEEVEDQVNTFLHCCLCLLKDPKAASKLTQMLTSCMKEQGEETTISAPLLPERDVFQVSKKKCTGLRV